MVTKPSSGVVQANRVIRRTEGLCLLLASLQVVLLAPQGQ